MADDSTNKNSSNEDEKLPSYKTVIGKLSQGEMLGFSKDCQLTIKAPILEGISFFLDPLKTETTDFDTEIQTPKDVKEETKGENTKLSAASKFLTQMKKRVSSAITNFELAGETANVNDATDMNDKLTAVSLALANKKLKTGATETVVNTLNSIDDSLYELTDTTLFKEKILSIITDFSNTATEKKNKKSANSGKNATAGNYLYERICGFLDGIVSLRNGADRGSARRKKLNLIIKSLATVINNYKNLKNNKDDKKDSSDTKK